jgi:tetratricopeptide (TPR) repeat protein
MAKNLAPRLKEALALRRQGRHEHAESVLRKVLAAQPGHAEALYHLALLKTDAGAYAEAHYFATSALAADSGSAPAHALLGRVQTATRSLEAALASYAQALAVQPQYAEALFGRGVVLQRLGRLTEALDSYAGALALAPGQAEAWNSHGNVLFALGRFDEALRSFDQGLRHMPDVALLHFNRGNALSELGRLVEALAAFDRALTLAPGNIDMLINRGNTRLEAGDAAGSAADFQRVIAEAPGDARGHNGLGVAVQDQGDLAQAETLYERASRLAPDFADAHHNLALVRLFRRDFAGAWREYEHRCEPSGYRANLRKDPRSVDLFERLPRWRGPGSPVSGPVGIWNEQGIGDQVLFSTLLPDLVATGQPFIYEVDRRLLAAYRRAFPECRFAAMDDPPAAELQTAGAALFAGSLPGVFRPSVASFARQPRSVLQAAPERVAQYRRRLGPGFKVALSWRSLRAGRLGRSKSVTLADFAPVLALPGVQFVDVQYGDTAAEREALAQAQGARLAHFDDVDCYRDLDEVLAILDACDLLVTTSNANAHLAAALGKPVWLLYPAERAPFHYWGHSGDHRSLWYPSVEIVSAPGLADWPQLIAYTAQKLGRTSAGFPAQ